MSELQAKKEKAEEIIRTYADMIYRLALQNLKNPDDASDIFQEVCISLLTKNAPLYDDVHIKYWLIRVTINKCRDLRKSAWNTRTEPLKPDFSVQAKEDLSALELVFSLPINYRNVVYLYYFEKYTVTEIAQILGKSKNTISSQLQRARKKLRTILEDGDNL
ncbi:MAG: sigma-70 family RNA polymerase sigma factor [Ruminococcus sp.]|nr:sigma-70 family RNA polymerase sigma factor [Ruminococcus sp.]